MVLTSGRCGQPWKPLAAATTATATAAVSASAAPPDVVVSMVFFGEATYTHTVGVRVVEVDREVLARR